MAPVSGRFIHIAGRRSGHRRGTGTRGAAACTTWWTMIPRRSMSSFPSWRRTIGAKPPRHLPRWVGRLARRRGRGDHDDRDPRSLEREGEARARAGAPLPELAAGLQGGTRSDRLGVRAPRRPAAADIRDRLPDARQRQRGRGRRPGDPAAGPQRDRAGGGDLLAARLRCHGGHPPGDRRAALGPSPARDLRRGVAARARDRAPGGRSRPAGRAGGLPLPRLPRRARVAESRAAGGVPAPRRLRLRLRTCRRDRRDQRGERETARLPRTTSCR